MYFVLPCTSRGKKNPKFSVKDVMWFCVDMIVFSNANENFYPHMDHVTDCNSDLLCQMVDCFLFLPSLSAKGEQRREV